MYVLNILLGKVSKVFSYRKAEEESSRCDLRYSIEGHRNTHEVCEHGRIRSIDGRYSTADFKIMGNYWLRRLNCLDTAP